MRRTRRTRWLARRRGWQRAVSWPFPDALGQVEQAVGRHSRLGCLVVLHGRELRDGARLEQTSRFGDDRWVLTPAILQRHERGAVLDFTRVPAAHRAVARELFD